MWISDLGRLYGGDNDIVIIYLLAEEARRWVIIWTSAELVGDGWMTRSVAFTPIVKISVVLK